jgi:hypothetical protein
VAGISVAKLLMQILENHLNVSGFGMWCAMSAQKVIAPAFSEESFDHYVKLVRQFRELIDEEKCGVINFLCKIPRIFLYSYEKQFRNRPGVAQRVPGGLGSQTFMTFGTRMW